MTTMWGADADALDALAVQVRSSGRGLDGTQARLSRSIHASPWRGPNADRFRHQWDGEYRRSMLAASSFLDDAGEALERNADQQRTASTTDGQAPGRGTTLRDLLDDLRRILPGVDLDDWLDGLGSLLPPGAIGSVIGVIRDLMEGPGDLLEAFVGFVDEAITRGLVHVRGYVRASGTVVDAYVRWRPGQADLMRRFFGDASSAVKLLPYLKWGGRFLDGVGGLVSGYERWADSAHLPTDERWVASLTAGGAAIGTDVLMGIGAGALAVALLPATAPAVAVAGVAIGIGVAGSWLWEHSGAGDWVEDHAVDAALGAYRKGEEMVGDAVEKGRELIDDGQELLSDGADLVEKGWDKVTPW